MNSFVNKKKMRSIKINLNNSSAARWQLIKWNFIYDPEA